MGSRYAKTIRAITAAMLCGEAALIAAYAYYVAPLIRDGILDERSGNTVRSSLGYALRIGASAAAIAVCLWACWCIVRQWHTARGNSWGLKSALVMNALMTLATFWSLMMFPVFTAVGAVSVCLCAFSLRTLKAPAEPA